VDYLDEILAKGDDKLDVVLQLTADDKELVHRLLGRARETGRSDDNEASSVTALTCTTSRPKPWWRSTPSAASSPRLTASARSMK
jgi:adenylate kinase family enzyme